MITQLTAQHGDPSTSTPARMLSDDGSTHLWRIAKCDRGYEVLESISERSHEQGLDWTFVAHVSGAFGRRIALDSRLEEKYAKCRNLRYDAKASRGNLRDGQRLPFSLGEMHAARERVAAAINTYKAGK